MRSLVEFGKTESNFGEFSDVFFGFSLEEHNKFKVKAFVFRYTLFKHYINRNL